MDYDHAVGDIYELAFESALAGIAIADLEGELRRVNPAFIDMWGYDDEDEIVGRSPSSGRIPTRHRRWRPRSSKQVSGRANSLQNIRTAVRFTSILRQAS